MSARIIQNVFKLCFQFIGSQRTYSEQLLRPPIATLNNTAFLVERTVEIPLSDYVKCMVHSIYTVCSLYVYEEH